MVRIFCFSCVLADGASSSSCNTRGVPFSMPKSTSGYSTSNRGNDVVGLSLGAALGLVTGAGVGVTVVAGLMCKILPSVIGLVLGSALGGACVPSSMRTLSAWAQSFNAI